MFSVFLIALSLSMDAFAVSVTNGLTLRRPFRPSYSLWMGLYFGGFQFLMPLLGCALGVGVRSRAAAWGHYIGFALLALTGGKMIADSLRDDEAGQGMSRLSHPRLAVLAVATSIDALAVGVSFAFVPGLPLLPACAVIGGVAFALSAGGAFLGSRIPELPGFRPGLAGGLVLIAIGLRLLWS